MTKEDYVKWLRDRADVLRESIALEPINGGSKFRGREVLALLEAADMIEIGMEPDGSIVPR